tara:strand:+ start:729 stop:1586 length:858 start_codon:yes stop_codon:yes gene_type:complete
MSEKIKIGIVGSGTMGNGIAHVFAIHGYSVFIVDISKEILKNAISTISNNMQRQCNKNIISNDDMKNALKIINTSTTLESLRDCSLIIEAVKEDINIKSEIFKKLDSLCGEKTIFASNTSSISINTLSRNFENPRKFIGMHFMNPVPIMKLIEVINGEKTSKETTDLIFSISKSINKIPVECNDSPGFVSNRILMPMINEAALCFEEGIATAESIDQIMMLGMSHPMGPLKLADLIGIDVCIYILNILYNDFNNSRYKPAEVLLTMKKNNKLGKKTGKGFYNYEF